MAESASRRRRLHMMVDQEDYSSKTEGRQKQLQNDMISLLEEAAASAGLDPGAWDRQHGGDSLFAVMLDEVDDALVIDTFSRRLDSVLGEYNAYLKIAQRLRLRVALVHGISIEGAAGRPGQAPVTAARLVDAPVVKGALTGARDANLVVVIDDRLFEDVIRQREGGLKPEAWVQVRIKVKKFDARAYLSIPGHHPAVPPAGTVTEPPTETQPGPGTGVTVHGNHNITAGRDNHVGRYRASGR